MTATIEVFMLGESGRRSDLVEPSWPVALRLIPTGVSTLAELAKSQWNPELSDGEADLVAISADSSRESLKTVAMNATLLGADREVAAHLSFNRIDSARLVLDRIGTIACSSGVGIILVSRAEHGPIVLRRNRLRKIGPFRPIAEPVWDWVIRAARSGQKVVAWNDPNVLNPTGNRLPLLVPPVRGSEADWLREHLSQGAIDELNAGALSRSGVDQTALRAGLYQWHDFLNESHELSQSIEGQGGNQLGDYWHAIMHRREPDYSNAKYWFRQIGNQPTYRELRRQADVILDRCTDPEAPRWRNRLQSGSKWDPLAFVDLCEECAANESSELALAARGIQYAEMSLLV